MSSAGPVLYADLWKKGNTLLTKDYPSKVEVKADATIGGDTPVKVSTKVVRASDGSVSGSLAPKWSFASHGLTVKASISTSKAASCDVTKTNLLVDGLDATVKVSTSAFDTSGKESIRADLTFRSARIAANGGLDVLGSKSSGTFAFVVPYKSCQLGVEADVLVGANADLRKLNTTLAYHPDGTSDVTFFRRASGKVTYGASYFKQVKDGLSVVSHVTYETGKESKELPQLQFAMGYDVDTSSRVKAKCGTNGRVAISYATQANDFAHVTMGLDFSTSDSKDHKVGLAVALA